MVEGFELHVQADATDDQTHQRDDQKNCIEVSPRLAEALRLRPERLALLGWLHAGWLHVGRLRVNVRLLFFQHRLLII